MVKEPAYRQLYTLLAGMEHAAARRDAEEVVRVRDLFIQEYNRVMPPRSDPVYNQPRSVPNLYDKARNMFLYAIDDIFSPTEKERQYHLKKGRSLLEKLAR